MRKFPTGVVRIQRNAVEYTRGHIGGFYVRPHVGVEKHAGGSHYIDHSLVLFSGDIRVYWKHPTDGRAGIVEVEGPRVLGEDLPMWLPINAEMEHYVEGIPGPVKAVWECAFAEAETEKLADTSAREFPYHMGPRGPERVV